MRGGTINRCRKRGRGSNEIGSGEEGWGREELRLTVAEDEEGGEGPRT